MGRKRKWNDGWLFREGDASDCLNGDYDDTEWVNVSLPHDWSILGELSEEHQTGPGGGFVRAGVGWYRKHFKYTGQGSERSFLLFDGVYMDSYVYLNGKRLGGCRYGYSSFEVELTDHLKNGENVLAVRVDNSRQPNSRWYSGSGIYRNVWFIEKEPIYIEQWGIRCDTNGIYPEKKQASLNIRAEVCNTCGEEVWIHMVHRILDKDEKEVVSCGCSLMLGPGEKGNCIARPSMDNPHLWTNEDPYLYTLESSAIYKGKTMDTERTRIGIRTAVFDKDRGFLLNGIPEKIKGMCIHHDCGIVGACGYRGIWEHRLRTLKEMGCNGIRCAHNPPDPIVLDLCDELGFLVMDEILDEWMLIKNKSYNYYSEQAAFGSGCFFEKDAEKDLRTMLRRDYNHPSVILWSIGNEIPEQSSTDGVKILRCLQDICHEEDPGRMVTSACDNIAAVEQNRTLREFENALDVVGYNYVGRWRERAENFYEEDRRLFPDRRFIGSENPSAGGKRGGYEYDETGNRYAGITLHHEALWRYTVSHDFVAGDFLWTGIDYLGEAMWPYRGAGCGPIDTAGFKKDTFYYFKSIWNSKEITLHLLPHWNWKGAEGEFRQVICYTNCEEVRLFINGRFVGSRGYECPRYGARTSWNDCFGKRYTTNDLHLSWDVPYEPGVLRAEGYMDGKLVQTEEIVTTKAPHALYAEYRVCDGSGEDGLSQIEVSCLDEDGRPVPDASPMVHCKIEGNGELLGMDGGDLADLGVYQKTERRMCAGKLLAVIKDADVETLVSFKAEGLKEAVIRLGHKIRI